MKRKEILSGTAVVILISFTVILLNKCGSKKALWGDPASGLLLSYRLADGQTWKTKSVSKQITNMEMMGQSMEATTDITMHVSYQGEGETSDNNLQITVLIDSMNMVSKSMRGEREMDVQSLVNKPFGLVLSPIGDEVEFQNTDSIVVKLGPMGGGSQSVTQFLRDPFPDLSTNHIKVGDSWLHQVNEEIPEDGQVVNIALAVTNTLDKIEVFQGEECAVIHSEFEGTLDGEGERMGANFTMEGDIEGTTTYYFAYKKGCFLKQNTESIMESTIAVTGQSNMTIPMSQETKAETTLSL